MTATSMFARFPFAHHWQTPDGDLLAIVGYAADRVLVERPGEHGCWWVNAAIADTWTRAA